MAAEDSKGLTLERLKHLIHYDPETGVFTRIRAKKRVRLGEISNTAMTDGHTRIKVDNYPYLTHRLAWFYVHGTWPAMIDHINGNPEDNRISNLREVNHRLNMQNKRAAYSNNKCGYLGVRFRQGKYEAQIYANGVKRYLGRFATAEEAHNTYLIAKRRLHEGCTI